MYKNILAVMAFVTIVSLIASATYAHDKSRPELDGWFNHLASGKGLCCSYADGEAIADADWKSDNGHYQVRLDGIWIEVPEDAVIAEPNRDGRTMVWPIRYGGELAIRCFMPGAMT